jgi:hypothetical protein
MGEREMTWHPDMWGLRKSHADSAATSDKIGAQDYRRIYYDRFWLVKRRQIFCFAVWWCFLTRWQVEGPSVYFFLSAFLVMFMDTVFFFGLGLLSRRWAKGPHYQTIEALVFFFPSFPFFWIHFGNDFKANYYREYLINDFELYNYSLIKTRKTTHKRLKHWCPLVSFSFKQNGRYKNCAFSLLSLGILEISAPIGAFTL